MKTLALAGEVLVNLGGEPERDDSGLPPVDIEIPDDARELDRDVQAYRRELRALRRYQRRKRLRGPLTRDGVVLPLLASCLVLALIAGTLLTVFTAGPGGDLPDTIAVVTGGANTSGPAPSKTPTDSPVAVLTRGLPDQVVRIGGTRVRLPTLTPSVLALVPAGCACTAATRQLVGQASDAGVRIYLFGDGDQLATVRRLAKQARGHAVVADDVSGALGKRYPHSGLTALLVRLDGTVAVATPLSPGFVLSGQLRRLSAPAASPFPARSTSPPTAPVR